MCCTRLVRVAYAHKRALVVPMQSRATFVRYYFLKDFLVARTGNKRDAPEIHVPPRVHSSLYIFLMQLSSAIRATARFHGRRNVENAQSLTAVMFLIGLPRRRYDVMTSNNVIVRVVRSKPRLISSNPRVQPVRYAVFIIRSSRGATRFSFKSRSRRPERRRYRAFQNRSRPSCSK